MAKAVHYATGGLGWRKEDAKSTAKVRGGTGDARGTNCCFPERKRVEVVGRNGRRPATSIAGFSRASKQDLSVFERLRSSIASAVSTKISFEKVYFSATSYTSKIVLILPLTHYFVLFSLSLFLSYNIRESTFYI